MKEKEWRELDLLTFKLMLELDSKKKKFNQRIKNC